MGKDSTMDTEIDLPIEPEEGLLRVTDLELNIAKALAPLLRLQEQQNESMRKIQFIHSPVVPRSISLVEQQAREREKYPERYEERKAAHITDPKKLDPMYRWKQHLNGSAGRGMFVCSFERFEEKFPNKVNSTKFEFPFLHDETSEQKLLSLPVLYIERYEGEESLRITELMVRATLAKSKREAKKMIQGRAISLNDSLVTDPLQEVTFLQLLLAMKLSVGKKKHFRLITPKQSVELQLK